MIIGVGEKSDVYFVTSSNLSHIKPTSFHDYTFLQDELSRPKYRPTLSPNIKPFNPFYTI